MPHSEQTRGTSKHHMDVAIPPTLDIQGNYLEVETSAFPTMPSSSRSTDTSDNFKLPAPIDHSDINNGADKQKFVKTEIPDSDDYSAYSPDDREQVLSTGTTKTNGALGKAFGRNDIDLTQQDDTEVSEILSGVDNIPEEMVDIRARDAAGMCDSGDGIQQCQPSKLTLESAHGKYTSMDESENKPSDTGKAHQV